MFTFLLVVHAIIAAALVTVILMQRSEGGGLGMGGSPSGLMSARGAADFLTRLTSILATVFVVMSIALAFLAASRQTQTIDTSLARTVPAPKQDAVPNTPADAAPATPSNAAAPATAPADNGAVPLAR
ncbi:preprotein translocase subunit SecG [Sphingomonas sp. MA1305]|uniref:preprotein translocase subunit SecG n=1 Tax=unclassified Sphingomonas TaxID=196159 RepID=UPI0018DFCE01|nr:preprotein translocase subunit SecG [Sphingomonas sp. MA1305]MBI0474775.1 preprotein translocase subunit SecG [Sphingomonas sp. MA1305]